jgi:hypothetical protein
MPNAAKMRIVVIATSCLLLGGLLLGGAAKAVTDTTFRYVPPQVGHIQIPPAAMVAQDSGAGYLNTGWSLNGTAAVLTCFYAPVGLPHGAKMTQLTAWYQNPNPDTVDLAIKRHRVLDGKAADVIAKSLGDSGDDQRKIVTFPINNSELRLVDNNRFIYYLRLCMNGSNATVFYGARVTFTYTSAGY